MYIDNSQQMDGLFKSVGKALNKVVQAPLKVATKVASKVLPDKVEKAALAVPKAVTNLTAKSITATAAVSDATTRPFARAIKKNPIALQAAGAVASVIPGLQPVGAALIGSGRIIQQRNAQRDQKAAEEAAKRELDKMQAQMQIDLLKTQVNQPQQSQYAPPQSTVITVPGGGYLQAPAGGSPAAKDNTPLYIGAGLVALAALFAMSNRPMSNRPRR